MGVAGIKQIFASIQSAFFWKNVS